MYVQMCMFWHAYGRYLLLNVLITMVTIEIPTFCIGILNNLNKIDQQIDYF